MSLREDYDLPKRPPVPHRMWAVMVGIVVLALVLWYVLPASPVTVAVLVVLLLTLVFVGVQRVLASRPVRDLPEHEPAPPRASPDPRR